MTLPPEEAEVEDLEQGSTLEDVLERIRERLTECSLHYIYIHMSQPKVTSGHVTWRQVREASSW